MVAEKTSKRFTLKVTEIQYLALYVKMKRQTNVCFQKQKRQQNFVTYFIVSAAAWKFYALVEVIGR